MKPWVESNWALVTVLLATTSVTSDVMAKLQHFWFCVGLNCVAAPFWGWLLGSRAPFGRSITAFSVLNYLGSAALGGLVFHDTLSRSNYLGMGLGMVAIALML